ncbi:MAG: SRPBCC family protein [Gammaproteobacteria bacterium]
MTIGEPHFIKLVRIYDAPCERVFAAWTDKERLRRWFAPRGFTIEEYSGEGRPGAAWRVCFRSRQGGEYRSSGVCKEIAAPERVVYTHSWEDENDARSPETTVTVRFSELAGRTLLEFHQAVFPDAESRDRHEEGWCTCLERLAEHLDEK